MRPRASSTLGTISVPPAAKPHSRSSAVTAPVEGGDLLGLGGLGQHDHVGGATHDGGQILAALAVKRVDADRGNHARRLPGGHDAAADVASARSLGGRREVLEVLDDDVGAARRRAFQVLRVGTTEETATSGADGEGGVLSSLMPRIRQAPIIDRAVPLGRTETPGLSLTKI